MKNWSCKRNHKLRKISVSSRLYCLGQGVMKVESILCPLFLSIKNKSKESGQDSRVRRPWAHRHPWTHWSFNCLQFSSVQSDSLQPHGLQHARLPCPSPTPRIYSNSCPLSRWCHPIISSSVIPFSSRLQSFPASETFQMSQLFAWGGQSTGVSALASFLPKNTQDWCLEWTGWISLQSKGLSRVFSNTTVQKHQYFGTQLSLSFNSHIHTWPQEKP